jgi:hypothetical protein
VVDREKVMTVLRRRFPEAPSTQVAAAVNAIVGLEDDWEEVTDHERDFGYHSSVQCRDICYIAGRVADGDTMRVFRKKTVTS